MQKNKFKILILLIVSIFMYNVSAYAFSDTIGPIVQNGSKVTTNGYDTLGLKHYGSTSVFCTEFHKESPALVSATCSKVENWANNIKVGVASIIRKVGTVEIAGNAPINYYYGELAINEFLCNSGIETSVTCVSSDNKRTTEQILGDYYSWYTEAIAVRDSYKDASLIFSSSKLTFTLQGDSYVSNTINVTKSFSDNFKITSTIGEVKQSGDSFYVVVPSSLLTAGTSKEVKVTASISKTVDMAQNYDCGDDVQTVTPNEVEAVPLKTEKSITGTITVEKIKGSLEIEKIDAKTNEPLQGVEFALYSGNSCSGTAIKKGTTAADGKVKFDDLDLGTYLYKETKTIDGYIINSECKEVKITSSTTVTEKMTNDKIKGSLEIQKIDKNTKKPLQGVEFALYSGNSCSGTAIKGTTEADGKVKFSDLELGTYSYKETKTIDGYIINSECKAVEITSSTTVTKTETNDKVKGSLEIQKIDAKTKEPLEGVQFSLYSGNSCSGQKLKKLTTGPGGKVKFSDLDLGTYSYKETRTINGYIINSKCEVVEITSSTEVKRTETNDKIKGSLTITKRDTETRNVLEGVEFALYSGDSCGGTVLTTGVTKADGKVKFGDLDLGSYSYKETKTIDGYKLNDICQNVKVTEGESDFYIDMTNDQIEVQIIKINKEDGKPLSGAKLHLETADGDIVESWVTDENPRIFKGLAIGIYYVVEDEAPEGYILNKTKTKFEIKANIDKLEVKVKNSQTTVEISKVNSVDGNELPGATLQILDKDKNKMSCTVKKDNNSTEVLDECTWVSEDKAKVIVGLLPGKYYLEETIAPDGYVLNETAVEFEVKEDGTVDPVIMINELEVDVPDTLSARSTLLIAISMFDIALGIGILTYVKKNKAQE